MNDRLRTIEKYNLHIYDEFKVDGPFQMPVIDRENIIPDKLIGFNYMLTAKDKHVGVHMYVDDYQFERLWNTPEKYIDKLKEFECVFTPDFSLYMDMPLAMKIWNVYRSRLLGQYWQSQGIKVIPTISWAEPESYNFCFDGIEKESIVSISTVGVKNSEHSIKIWKDGVGEMIKRIDPYAILIYGEPIEFDFKGIPVFYYDNEVIKRLRKIEVKNGWTRSKQWNK